MSAWVLALFAMMSNQTFASDDGAKAAQCLSKLKTEYDDIIAKRKAMIKDICCDDSCGKVKRADKNCGSFVGYGRSCKNPQSDYLDGMGGLSNQLYAFINSRTKQQQRDPYLGGSGPISSAFNKPAAECTAANLLMDQGKEIKIYFGSTWDRSVSFVREYFDKIQGKFDSLPTEGSCRETIDKYSTYLEMTRHVGAQFDDATRCLMLLGMEIAKRETTCKLSMPVGPAGPSPGPSVPTSLDTSSPATSK